MLRLIWVTLGIWTFLTFSIAWGEVQLSTIPGRESVKVTIYKGIDIAYVEESRLITLRNGENRLQFGWADTRIDPSSIRLLPQTPDVSIQTAISSFEEPNTVVWKVRAEERGRKPLKITYFIGGMDWDVDYMAISSEDETKLSIEGYVGISNKSGEDFKGVSLKLVAGEINRVIKERYAAKGEGMEKKDRMLRMEMRRVAGRGKVQAAPMVEATFTEAPMRRAGEAGMVSEHYLLTIERRTDLKNEWGKRLKWLSAEKMPMDVVYLFDPSKYGGSVVKQYRFKNDEKHNLGTAPIPPGRVIVYGLEGDQLIPIGETKIDFTPVGGDVKLTLNSKGEVTVRRKRMNFAKINFRFDRNNWVAGYDTEEEYQIKVRNHRKVPSKVEVYERFRGEWEITSKSHDYERKDARTILFKLDLPPGSEEIIKYTVVIKREGGVRK
ncbi:TPA: hypothetical protein EYP37_08010 [Candidatus Poribacteria bacterium]|nr:hypothetical protein [Candidatus Poribacteria bacterium]